MEKSIAIKDLQEYVKSKSILKPHMDDRNAWLLKFLEGSGELAKAILRNCPQAKDGIYKNTLDEEFGNLLFCLCAIANLYDVDIEKWFAVKQQEIDADGSVNYFSGFFGSKNGTTRASEKRDTWEEFDKLVDEINEKLNFEDFPRCDLSRPLIDFNGARA